MTKRADSVEYRAELRREIREMRAMLCEFAGKLDTVDHEAAGDIHRATSALFAAWSKLRQAPPADAVCPLIRKALGLGTQP